MNANKTLQPNKTGNICIIYLSLYKYVENILIPIY